MDASSETASYFANAQGVISKILASQSPNVDAVSGATYSSNGIITAVQNALSQAIPSGNQAVVTPTPTPSPKPTKKPSPIPKPGDEQIYKDGTYTGTGKGYSGTITLTAKIKKGVIKSLEAEHTDTPVFFKKAWDILENEIIQNQSVEGIDTVSGATYSSKGIINAMKDILKQAEKDTTKVTPTPTPEVTVTPIPEATPIPTPEEPLIVKSLNIAQPDLLTITLTKQAALTASDFQVWAKKYESADYLKQYTIGQITTTDSLTYKIKLTGDSVLQKNSYIKVVVPKLNLSRECIYRDETYTIEKSETYVYKLGDSVDKSQTLGKGYSNCSVSGLPAGVKYQIKTAAATCTLKFNGNVTKQGKYTSKLVYEDELGNKFSMTIIWLVYDGTELLVKDAEKVLTTAWGTTLPQLKVYGGNGTDTSDYTYEILREESDSAALAVSSLINGGAGIQVSSPKLSTGTYKLRIRATDKTDTSMTSTGTLTLKIIEGGYLQGKVKDANGDPLTSFQFTMKNQNEYAEYTDEVSGRWNGVSKDGVILMDDLEAGTYDVAVSSYSGTVGTTVYNLKTQKAAYGTDDVHPVWSFDVTLPVYKVTIELDPDVPDAVKNITGFGNWQDVSDGSYYGSTKTVYLENGTHHLTCRKSISGEIYNFYLDVTVNGSNTTAYAYVKE